MALCDNIKKRRIELGMTQQELAEKMSYKSRSTIAKIESGENDITQSKLNLLAEILNTTPAILINERNEEEIHENISKNRNIALILAGGKSSRANQDIPCQFMMIENKPVIIYVLEVYQKHPAINEIVVVCLSGWEEILIAYANQYKITKLKTIIPAGKTGEESIYKGVIEINNESLVNDVIVIQEATRPMVSQELISGALAVCKRFGSAVTCMPFTDFLPFLVRDDGTSEYIDRYKLYGCQSPLVYPLSKLVWAFKEGKKRGYSLSDSTCVMLMYKLGEPLNINISDHRNIKITRAEDIAVFRSLVRISDNK